MVVEEVVARPHIDPYVLSMAAEIWRIDAVGMERLKQLEEESPRIKGFVANLSLGREMQDVIRRKF